MIEQLLQPDIPDSFKHDATVDSSSYLDQQFWWRRLVGGTMYYHPTIKAKVVIAYWVDLWMRVYFHLPELPPELENSHLENYRQRQKVQQKLEELFLIVEHISTDEFAFVLNQTGIPAEMGESIYEEESPQ